MAWLCSPEKTEQKSSATESDGSEGVWLSYIGFLQGTNPILPGKPGAMIQLSLIMVLHDCIIIILHDCIIIIMGITLIIVPCSSYHT